MIRLNLNNKILAPEISHDIVKEQIKSNDRFGDNLERLTS
jgi:hypothetical protein